MQCSIMKNGFGKRFTGDEVENNDIDEESTVLRDIGFCLWNPEFIEKVESGFMEKVDVPGIRPCDVISVGQVSDGSVLINDQQKSEPQVNVFGADCSDELRTFIGTIVEECIQEAMKRVCDSNDQECSIWNRGEPSPRMRVQSRVTVGCDQMGDGLGGVRGGESSLLKSAVTPASPSSCVDPLVPLLSLHKKSMEALNEFDWSKDTHMKDNTTERSDVNVGHHGEQTSSGNQTEPNQALQVSSLKNSNLDSKCEMLASSSRSAGDFHFCCVNSCASNRIMDTTSDRNGGRLNETSELCTCGINSCGEKGDFYLGRHPGDGLNEGDVRRTTVGENGLERHNCAAILYQNEAVQVKLEGKKCPKCTAESNNSVFKSAAENGYDAQVDDVESLDPAEPSGLRFGPENDGNHLDAVLSNSGISGAVSEENSNSDSSRSVEESPDLVWDSDYDVIKDFNECLLEAERFVEISPPSEYCDCLVVDDEEMGKKNRGSRLPSIQESSEEGAEETPPSDNVFSTIVVPVRQGAAVESSVASGDRTVAVGDHGVSTGDKDHSKLSDNPAERVFAVTVQSVERSVVGVAGGGFDIPSCMSQQVPGSSDTQQGNTSYEPTLVPKLVLDDSGASSPENSDSSGISPRDLELLQKRTKKLLNGHSITDAAVTMAVEISQVPDSASAEPSPTPTQDSGVDFQPKSRELLTSESGSENFSLGSENLSLERSAYTHETCDDSNETLSPTVRSPGEKFEKSLLYAIQSLDSLNEQIVQFIYTPKVEFSIEDEFSPKDREALKSSMAIMRRLLVDAQVKFRKMVDDNRQLASRIDGSILTANQEMQELRQELQDTNKRLSQLGQSGVNGTVTPEYQNGNGTNGKGRRLSEAEQEIVKLQGDNSKLEKQINSLMFEIKELKSTKAILSEQPSLGDLKLELIQYQQELVRAKEALQAMKSDRKRLKAEKVDLLSQMKQLYQTLEEKEAELREFIRNYELRMRESDEGIKQLALEKDEAEREKWEILKRARDAAERVVILKSDLDERNAEIHRLEEELAEARNQIRELKDIAHKQKTASTSDTGISSGTDVQTPSEEQLPTYFITNLSTRITSSSSSDNLRHLGERSRSAEDVTNISGGTLSSSGERQKKKKKTMTGFSSLSRMFSRSKNRKSVLLGDNSSLEDISLGPSSPRVSTLNEENINEKLQTVSQLKDIPLVQWKADHVLAWLEIVMNMPRYGRQCAENIKGGRILAEMSDSELEAALGVTNYLHRKKLRLAIEDLKDPTQVRYPEAGAIDHIWVAQVWMRDIGLPQYSAAFEAHHIDGRVLNSLTKKEMERCMQITRKFHQASILHGVELLRRVNFNQEALAQRRSQCETFNCDPLVWTNDRLIQWINSIDLQEYAPNLIESGVHGAMLVLESSFNAETMAAALAIPPSKSYIRRHLTSELDTLLKPARIAAKVKIKKRNLSGSIGKSFERSFRGPGEKDDGKKRISFRGSLGRAFGRKVKRDLAVGLPEMQEEPISAEKRSHSHEAIGTAV